MTNTTAVTGAWPVTLVIVGGWLSAAARSPGRRAPADLGGIVIVGVVLGIVVPVHDLATMS